MLHALGLGSPELWTLPVPLMEKIARSVLVYLAMVAMLRVFGKRELAQLNPFDLVVLLMISNTVQNAIIGPDNSLTGGIIGALTLLSVNYMVVRYLFRHRRLDELIEGKPITLIKKGKIQERAMAGELLTRSELLCVAHRQGYRSLNDVEECILEAGGTFFLRGKEPPVEDRRWAELTERLDRIEKALKTLPG